MFSLYEAACAGKAVVATGYSGPLDYLDPSAHALVRYRLAPVLQKYRFYSRDMFWAEPDWMHAAECLRSIYDYQDLWAGRSAVVGQRLRSTFSVEAVGRMARERLLHLLQA